MTCKRAFGKDFTRGHDGRQAEADRVRGLVSGQATVRVGLGAFAGSGGWQMDFPGSPHHGGQDLGPHELAIRNRMALPWLCHVHLEFL